MKENGINFCFYCGKTTEIIYKDLQKSSKGKMITVKNVPLHFCRSCREIFYPDFVINLFNNLAKKELKENVFEFGFLHQSILSEA